MIDIDALKRDKRPQSAWVVHALIDRLKAAEKERDDLRAAVRHEADCVEACKSEIERLRAKLEAAEKERDDVAQQLIQSEIGKRGISEARDALRADIMDAARYRWLRENGRAHEKRESRAVLPRGGKKASMAFRYWTTPEELDMAIDAMLIVAPEAKP